MNFMEKTFTFSVEWAAGAGADDSMFTTDTAVMAALQEICKYIADASYAATQDPISVGEDKNGFLATLKKFWEQFSDKFVSQYEAMQTQKASWPASLTQMPVFSSFFDAFANKGLAKLAGGLATNMAKVGGELPVQIKIENVLGFDVTYKWGAEERKCDLATVEKKTPNELNTKMILIAMHKGTFDDCESFVGDNVPDAKGVFFIPTFKECYAVFAVSGLEANSQGQDENQYCELGQKQAKGSGKSITIALAREKKLTGKMVVEPLGFVQAAYGSGNNVEWEGSW